MPENTVEQTAAPQAGLNQSAEDAAEQQNEELVLSSQEKKQEGGALVALLTTLVLLCLIVEVVLASYIGLTIYRNNQTNQLLAAQYEAYLEQLEEERANPPKVQYIGPSIRVVDGVLVESTSIVPQST